MAIDPNRDFHRVSRREDDQSLERDCRAEPWVHPPTTVRFYRSGTLGHARARDHPERKREQLCQVTPVILPGVVESLRSSYTELHSLRVSECARGRHSVTATKGLRESVIIEASLGPFGRTYVVQTVVPRS